jgi:glycosyltransferase involved in cell wall biosynthesis
MPRTNKINLMYIAEGGIFISVFDSQVKELLSILCSNLAHINLLLLEPYKDRKIPKDKKTKKLYEIKKLFNNVLNIKMPPILGLPSLAFASKRLIRQYSNIQPDIIHARGHIGSYIGLSFKRLLFKEAKFIADIRGVTKQEFLYSSSNITGKIFSTLRTMGFENLEKIICRESDHIFCVTNALSDYLVNASKINKEKITVIPTLTNTNIFFYNESIRLKMRKTLSIENRMVFIYVGSMAKWQMAKETIELFEHIRLQNKQAFLLFLTTEPAKATPLFKHIPENDYHVTSIKHEDINPYLNAADIAVLLRETHIVNKVAAPVKFGEYICSGLPVIASPGIGDTEAQIQNHEIGLIYDNTEKLIENLPNLSKKNRSKISQIGKELYGLDWYSKKIFEIYQSLL